MATFTKTFRVLALAGGAVSLGLAGSASATEVTFIGGSYAELCSTLAHNVDDVKSVELTGSRMAVPPIAICTLAINEEAGAPTDKAGSYNNRGVLHFDAGNFAAALADFDQAIRIADTLAAAHVNRGYTLVAMRRWEDSLDSFDRGITLGAPDPARAYFNRGIAYEESGNVRAAYYDYLKASELAPEWEEPKQELARFSVR